MTNDKNTEEQRVMSLRSLTLKDQRGFTLAELLVAAGLSLFVLASISGVFRAQTHTTKGQESRMEANEYALTVLDMIVREIRNAGYFPTGTACSSPANTAGIVSAAAQSFRLVYDTDGDGSCEEDVAFAYDSAAKNVTRTRNSTTESLTDGNATGFQFTYYPQQTSATAPAPYCVSTGVPSGCSGTLSSNLSAVQKITVSITVQPKSTDSQFTGSTPVTMTVSAEVRNHGL